MKCGLYEKNLMKKFEIRKKFEKDKKSSVPLPHRVSSEEQGA